MVFKRRGHVRESNRDMRHVARFAVLDRLHGYGAGSLAVVLVSFKGSGA
jgi:hypothetical protein